MIYECTKSVSVELQPEPTKHNLMQLLDTTTINRIVTAEINHGVDRRVTQVDIMYRDSETKERLRNRQ